VAVGNTDYHIWMTGSLPGHIRLHLLNAAPEDVTRLHIWYNNPQRKDVYKVSDNNLVVTEKFCINDRMVSSLSLRMYNTYLMDVQSNNQAMILCLPLLTVVVLIILNETLCSYMW